MATIRSILNGALRKLGVVGGQGRSASLQELADALEVLPSLYRRLITSNAFGRLCDVAPRDATFIPGENYRVLKIDPTQTITLPELVSMDGRAGFLSTDITLNTGTPTDTTLYDYGQGYRSSGSRRFPKDLAVITIVDRSTGALEEHIYDGQEKHWFSINALDVAYDADDSASTDALLAILSMEAPISHRDLNGMRCYLAQMLSADYATEVDAFTAAAARSFLYGITHHYDHHCPVDFGAGQGGAEDTDLTDNGYRFLFGFADPPLANIEIMSHVFTDSITFKNGWAGSRAHCEFPPLSAYPMVLKKNGAQCGQIIVAVTGDVTLLSDAEITNFAAGDVISLHSPVTQDDDIQSFTVTFKGQYIRSV